VCVCAVGTIDVLEHSNPAEAALRMDAICPAPQHAHLATLLPEMWDIRLTTLGPVACVLWWGNRFRTGHILEWTLRAEPALWVHTISLATKHPNRAVRVPEVRHGGHHCEIAHVRPRTMDVHIVPLSAKSAVHILAIGIAAMLAQCATWLPVVGGRWLVVKVARSCLRRGSALRAGHPSVGEVSAEAALAMNPIRPATQLAGLAVVVPIVGHVGILREVAAARWTWHGAEVATAAQAALDVLAVTIATELAHLTGGVPEGADADRLVIEVTLAACLGARLRGLRLCKRHGAHVEEAEESEALCGANHASKVTHESKSLLV